MNPDGAFQLAARSWQSFYMLTGTAAATLTGLMFLSVTFGARLVTKKTFAAAEAFTTPTALHFVIAFALSGLMLAPVLTGAALGWILLALGVYRLASLRWVFRVFGRIQEGANDIEGTDWLYHLILPLVACLLLLAAAAGFLLGAEPAFIALAAYVLMILILGIMVAWDILLWMVLKIT